MLNYCGLILLIAFTALTNAETCSDDAKRCYDTIQSHGCKAVQKAECFPHYIACISAKGFASKSSLITCQAEYSKDLTDKVIAFNSVCRNPDPEDAQKLICCLCENNAKTKTFDELIQAHKDCSETISNHECNKD